jgi:hypothetical protein
MSSQSWLNSTLLSVAACGGVLLSSAVARADYVCYAGYVPGTGTGGTEGHVQGSFWSAPGCSGSFVAFYTFCSTGATSSSCASGTLYRYERHGLLSLNQMLQRAAAADQRLSITTTSCLSGTGTCAAGLYARSD